MVLQTNRNLAITYYYHQQMIYIYYSIVVAHTSHTHIVVTCILKSFSRIMRLSDYHW